MLANGSHRSGVLLFLAQTAQLSIKQQFEQIKIHSKEKDSKLPQTYFFFFILWCAFVVESNDVSINGVMLMLMMMGQDNHHFLAKAKFAWIKALQQFSFETRVGKESHHPFYNWNKQQLKILF
uniref:Uncharacterized protein n=1 Tax=Ananas comosus var. bracteatus TaxID=296719 RepID=A0A6V7QYE9_ANACO